MCDFVMFFHDYDRFCNAGLPSDITVFVEGVNFHLHKFPLVSRCGKLDKEFEASQDINKESSTMLLEGFPGGPDTFLIAAKFCYGLRIDLTPRNIMIIYCAADYLEMTDQYGSDNLLSWSDSFFHKNILRNWKDCIVTLQSAEPVIPLAEKLQLIDKCLNAVSTMVCTDPSLFGWPMMMYGSLQSPGGSILWNGINTGARIRSAESDWWYEDISYLCIDLFEKLIKTMQARGIRPENIAGAIMYYTRKFLPGLGRWQGGHVGKTRTVASFSLTPVTVDQKVLLETIAKLLPEKKSKSYCRFLLGILRTALILDVSEECKDYLEKRVGMQLDLATLDGLLIPTYSDSDTLYDTDCVQRIIQHFVSTEPKVPAFSPCSPDIETSLSSESLRKVAKLVDGYVAEVASDVNLKPDKIRALVEALPEDCRPFHDGLYRALDIYFKDHPWLSDKEKEQLCNMIDYQRLSIDACTHASQNERLPLRVVLQVLFFEQMHLRTAIAGCLHVDDPENGPTNLDTAQNALVGQIIQRDGWVSVVRENHGLKGDMDRMRCRVQELEEEFSKIKQKMRKVSKSHSSLSSPRLVAWRIGCKLLPRSSNAQRDVVEVAEPSPRASVDQPNTSRSLRHRKSLSLFQ
ncbi:BTB/POZ domain-containing protein At3g44820-like isoform X1 [Chenopodium quinoa]|uniref:BTB/POZ domain-containing protein At3g44820-like isoform X1 n=1 Tax=Chenopodium quinoa TaxID=63459 RepID=UPI000B797A9E|nr:BTB/POZ domain-containing protein At3g44820-like isoform X1 [Chenopodium quinoa]